MKIDRLTKLLEKRIIRISSVVALVFLLTMFSFNVYGRQHYDPSGFDTVNFDPEGLIPGKNTVFSTSSSTI